MGGIAGYSIVVTGASEGLGRGIALAVGTAGAGVVVTALDLAAAEAVAGEIIGRGGRAVAARCDVRDRADMAQAVQVAEANFGKLDGFVHNANALGGSARTIQDITDTDWDNPTAVGLRAIFHSAHVVLPALARTKGAMVSMTSQAGVDGTPHLPVYSAIKGAQRAIAKSLAREWGPLGVRVNTMAPSAETPALESYLKREPWMRQHMIDRSPLRRFGHAETDIGRALTFLIGPDSAFVTGQMLTVNGGGMMV
jgi:3-oxoacyl-[acyl-carrier protein] reductase